MGGEEGKSGIVQGNRPAHELRLEKALACGLRQGAVNAGGSQVGGLGRGVFGRPDRNYQVPKPRPPQLPAQASTRTPTYTPAPSGYSSANFSSLASVSTVVPER